MKKSKLFGLIFASLYNIGLALVIGACVVATINFYVFSSFPIILALFAIYILSFLIIGAVIYSDHFIFKNGLSAFYEELIKP